MKSFKLFNFQGTPVYLSPWFFILFLIFSLPVTIGIFISVLLHEIGHTWMANRKGYNVKAIVIDLLYGSAEIDSNMHDRDSIPIVAAGPITTLLLAVISYILFQFIDNTFLNSLYTINLYLFVFNILPIYPLDGGLIVRSFANLSRNRQKARIISSIISLLFSLSLFVYGVWIWSFILSIFGVYFTYLTLKDLGIFK